MQNIVQCGPIKEYCVKKANIYTNMYILNTLGSFLLEGGSKEVVKMGRGGIQVGKTGRRVIWVEKRWCRALVLNLFSWQHTLHQNKITTSPNSYFIIKLLGFESSQNTANNHLVSTIKIAYNSHFFEQKQAIVDKSELK